MRMWKLRSWDKKKVVFKFVITLIIVFAVVLALLLIINNNTSLDIHYGTHEQAFDSEYQYAPEECPHSEWNTTELEYSSCKGCGTKCYHSEGYDYWNHDTTNFKSYCKTCGRECLHSDFPSIYWQHTADDHSFCTTCRIRCEHNWTHDLDNNISICTTCERKCEHEYRESTKICYKCAVAYCDLRGGHQMEFHEKKLTHCLEEGYSTDCYYCSKCEIYYLDENGKEYLLYSPLIEKGHKTIYVDAISATCTESGHEEYYGCRNFGCEAWFEDEEATKEITDKTSLVIYALGHDTSWVMKVEEKESTCIQPGNIAYYECSNHCGTYFKDEDAKEEITKEEIVIPAKGHTAGEAIRENEVVATCTKDGSYDNVVYCTVCKDVLSREKTIIAKIAHKFTNYISDGNATCTADGTKTAKCDYECGTDSEPVIDVGSKLEHDYKVIKTTDLVCEQGGTITYECSNCKYTYSETVPVNGHTFGEAVEENKRDATCTEKGSYDSVVYCTVCNKELSRETKTISTKGHTEEVIPSKAATCTETGLTEGKKCSVCGEVLVTQEKVAELGHTFGEWIIEKEATHEQEGYKYRICTRCNTEKDDEVIPKKEINIETTYTVKEDDNTKYIVIDKTCKVEEFLRNITSNSELIIKDKDGKVLNSDDKVPTGAKVITKKDEKEQFVVVLQGDVKCDGEVTFRDIISTNSIRINGEKDILQAQLFAADMNNTNKIEFRDIIMMNSIRINIGK